uniref:SKP1-like protein 7 isoform X2 n=1 Tax=Erigeron canadensis TaxID=72917 RepID=UPI001CB978AF|nr:SKP1-like protein 7 isoform X2 [Erigeron canadensis]
MSIVSQIVSQRSDALSKLGVMTVLNNYDEARLVCVSSDGRMFAVSAMESGFLKHFIDTKQFGKVYTEVPGHILEQVVYFIINIKYEERNTENYKVLESEFLQKNQRLLLDILLVAYDLQIQTLVDLVRKVVIDMIAEKTREEFAEIFNLSREEMSEMQKYKVWAIKPQESWVWCKVALSSNNEAWNLIPC